MLISLAMLVVGIYLAGIGIEALIGGGWITTADIAPFWALTAETDYTGSISIVSSIFGFFTLPIVWVLNLWKILSMDFTFFAGTAQYVRAFVLIFTVGCIIGIFALVRGTST